MTFPDCIFCDATLDKNTKPEHILQDALGGRKTTQRVICSKCNNDFGNGIDKAITEQVAVIRNMLQLPSGTGRQAPMIRHMQVGDKKINVRGDGSYDITSKPFTVTKLADGKFDISITVQTREELQRHIPHIAAAVGISVELLRLQLCHSATMSMISQRPDTSLFHLSLGGESAIRAATKACLVLWATLVGNDEVKSSNYTNARNFAFQGDEEFRANKTRFDTRAFDNQHSICHEYGDIYNCIYVFQ